MNKDKADLKIEQLKLKLKEASIDAIAEYKEQLQYLEEKKSSLETKYHILSDMAGEK